MNRFRISGTLEALGQHTFTEKDHTYAYLRFLDSAGQVVTEERVVVHNGCNSYLRPDLQGDFYIARFGKILVLYGLKVGDRSVIDIDEVLKGLALLGPLGVLLFILGIPLIFLFFLGVPMMQAGWRMMGMMRGPTREQMLALMNE